LRWTDNAGQLNSESYYRIERATNSSFTANLVTKATGANSTQFSASALAPNTTYFFRVSAVNAAGASAVVSAVTEDNAPPGSFVETGWYDFGSGGHNRTVYLSHSDEHVAIYYDQYVPNSANATWLEPIMSQTWQYIKLHYGHFSDPILYVIGNQANVPGTEGWFAGGGVQDVYSIVDTSYYRNIAFAAAGDWTIPEYAGGGALYKLTHEIGHLVESNNNGVSGSPSFGVWGDSKWAEIFQYDIHLNVAAIPSGIAAQTAQSFMTSVDQYGPFWFRDWYLPLYNGQLGNTAPSQKGVAVLSRYFQLLAEQLPQIDSRFGPRSVNLGELVHFYSGAAGVDLCHETTSNLQGFNCGNFASGRTFRVNNVLATCNYSNQALPAKRNGGYCFQASAGDYAWASATTF
jgi:hypothetical protein